jgi:hypothetical protein
MDETASYLFFGGCMLCGGVTLIYIYFNHQWRKSAQKAQQEFIEFWHHLEKLGVEHETIKEVAAQMKYITDLEKANKRLEKINRVPATKY